MDKSAIRDFAVKARYKLINEIVTRANMIGVSENGVKSPLAQSSHAAEYYDIGGNTPYELKGEDIKKRQSFIRAIEEKIKSGQSQKDAFQDIVEEIAYTWFNRIIAIRFMEVNDYLPSGIRVLSSNEKTKKEPDIVTHYYDADLNLSSIDTAKIEELKAKNKPEDLFKFLFIKQCNKLGEILPFLFEKAEDYHELLLTISYTDEQGVVCQLVKNVQEENFKEAVEIIGWMYQFYISEKKDAVFSSKQKITKTTLPAVTQLFTPDWIVKYMVENSLGKMWIDGHKTSMLKKELKYYVEDAEQELEVQRKINAINEEYAKKNIKDITFIDPCCGSGHILVYAFDLFYKMYQEQGYVASDIPALIIKNNLYGIDVDKRAMQLTCFALAMKARSYDKRYFKNAYIMPNVIDVKESNSFLNSSDKREFDRYFEKKLSNAEKDILQEVLFKFEDAELYGSLIKDFTYTPSQYKNLNIKLAEILSQVQILGFAEMMVKSTLESYVTPLLTQAEIMSQKYDIMATNPPYLPTSTNEKLSEFAKANYPDSKTDLFAMFMEVSFVKPNGLLAMINMHSWMFLKTYSSFRPKIFKYNFISMNHLGARAFSEIGGEVVQTTAFIIRNIIDLNANATFIRLVEGSSEYEKEQLFFERLKKKEIYINKPTNFSKIPSNPLAYWVSNKFINLFDKNKMFDYSDVITGMTIGNNDLYLRLWSEVDINKTCLNAESMKEITSSKFWIPYSKGGGRKNWYGSQDYIVNWSKKENFNRSKTTLQNYYLKEAVTWPFITSNKFSARYLPFGSLWDVAGSPCFFKSEKVLKYSLAFMCSRIADYILSVINPTINVQAIDIGNLPLIYNESYEKVILSLVNANIEEAKKDWDQYETSWDFKAFPLYGNKLDLIEKSYINYKNDVNTRFEQLKENEEELNKIFIEIYGLQDELTPEVADRDITVARIYDSKTDIPESMKGNNYVKTKQDVIKDLISYIIGCIFGRYSLDEEGLAYAGGQFDKSKYSTFMPDEDNIIPITDDEYLEEDVVSRIVEFVKTVYGPESLNQNLQFIADALAAPGQNPKEVIRNYMIKDFFKDHCQKYQNRPIYWLFDSGKENGFKALVYLHRYNQDTLGKMRTEYLHKVQRVYESEISRMQDIIENSTDMREVAFARKEKEKFLKQLLETKEYDEVLGHVALQRIALDLDDGVKTNYQKFQNIGIIKNGRATIKNLLTNIYKEK